MKQRSCCLVAPHCVTSLLKVANIVTEVDSMLMLMLTVYRCSSMVLFAACAAQLVPDPHVPNGK